MVYKGMSSSDIASAPRAKPVPEEEYLSRPRGLTPRNMRQVFLLVLTLLVLKAFMPEVGHRLEDALLALLNLATTAFSASQAQPLG
jgi:hypothetical protein